MRTEPTVSILRSPIGICAALLWASFALFYIVIPYLSIFLYSFHARDFYGGVLPSWSTAAWSDLLSKSTATIALRTSLMALANTILCVAIALPIALFLVSRPSSSRKWWLIAISLPMVLNTLLVAYSWQVILGRTGILNSALDSLGMGHFQLDFLYTPGSILIGLFSSYLAFTVLTLFVSLVRIDKGFARASHALGGSNSQTLLFVILPLARPGLLVASLLVFLPSFAEFVIPDLLGGGKTWFIGNYAQFCFYEGRNWPLGSALMVSLVFVLITVTLYLVRFFRDVF